MVHSPWSGSWHVFIINYSFNLIIMPDTLQNTATQDHKLVDANEQLDLIYVKEKLGVTTEQIQEAVKAVGNDRNLIEQYLREGKGNS